MLFTRIRYTLRPILAMINDLTAFLNPDCDPKDRYKKGNLRLGVITIDLSNVIAPNGKQVYKEYFDKVKEVLKDNELCNI